MYKGRKRAGGLEEGGITRLGGAGPDQSGKLKHHLSDPVSAILYIGGEKLLLEAFIALIKGLWDQYWMNPKTEGTPVRVFKQNR